jgi:integration host factor subunit beta
LASAREADRLLEAKKVAIVGEPHLRTAHTIRVESGAVMARTKAALIGALGAKAKLQLGRADALVNQIFDCRTDALRRGEGIEIRGFGSRSVRSYSAFDGRNRRSGEPIKVKARASPTP